MHILPDLADSISSFLPASRDRTLSFDEGVSFFPEPVHCHVSPEMEALHLLYGPDHFFHKSWILRFEFSSLIYQHFVLQVPTWEKQHTQS